jgi:DNA-binding FadR family transcriptional regulator
LSPAKTKETGQRAADRLMTTIADMIDAGALKAGEPLPPEREIVETYGVSRTVVREAVLALANRGLVEARPRHRPIVRKPGFDAAFETVSDIVGRLLVAPSGVRNLFDTRIMIETSLVRSAALEADKSHIAALKSALEANADAVHDSVLFYETDMAFHAVLYGVPNNPLMSAIHRAYTAWLEPHWLKMPRRLQRNQDNLEAHRLIYEGVLSRDADKAERAMRDHLEDAWEQVNRILTPD